MNTVEQSKKAVAQGVRNHLTILANMGGDASEPEVAQVAIQVLYALHPDLSDDSEDMRAFLVTCGFSQEFAEDMIGDDHPDGIY